MRREKQEIPIPGGLKQETSMFDTELAVHQTTQRLDSFVAPPQPVPIEQKLLSAGQRLVGYNLENDTELTNKIKSRFAEIADFLIELEAKKEFVNEHHKLLHNQALMQITSASQFTTKVLTYKILD